MNEDRDPPPISARRAAAGLIALAVVILAVLFIVHKLQESARMQDCLASGRTNCAPIEVPAGR